jgi:hypothetical protein
VWRYRTGLITFPGLLVVLLIFVGLLSWPLASVTRSIGVRVWTVAGLLILAGLLYPTSGLMGGLPTPIGIAVFLLPEAALVVSGMLVASAVRLRFPSGERYLHAGVSAPALRADDTRSIIAWLVLAGLLLAKTLHNLYWLTMWDNTYDPLGYFWLAAPLIAVWSTGIVMSISLPGRRKLAAGYAVLVVALLIGVSSRAQSVDFRALTEDRAARIVAAIEAYRAQAGTYPASLDELTPRYAFTLPGPMILYGQGWCYNSGEGYYRLGYVNREHWSAPRLSGRLAGAGGDAGEPSALCATEIAALKARYPDWFSDAVVEDYTG